MALKCPSQGFLIGEEFCRSFCDFFLNLFFVKPNHTLILLNQSEASKSELVRCAIITEKVNICLTLYGPLPPPYLLLSKSKASCFLTPAPSPKFAKIWLWQTFEFWEHTNLVLFLFYWTVVVKLCWVYMKYPSLSLVSGNPNLPILLQRVSLRLVFCSSGQYHKYLQKERWY